MILWIFIVLGLLLISYLGYKNWVGRAGEKYLLSIVRQQEGVIENQRESIKKMFEIQRADEEGRQEQEENYEMQFLTFKERIAEDEKILEARNKYIIELEGDLEFHFQTCLPSLKDLRWFALASSAENV